MPIRPGLSSPSAAQPVKYQAVSKLLVWGDRTLKFEHCKYMSIFFFFSGLHDQKKLYPCEVCTIQDASTLPVPFAQAALWASALPDLAKCSALAETLRSDHQVHRENLRTSQALRKQNHKSILLGTSILDLTTKMLWEQKTYFFSVHICLLVGSR